MYRCNGPDYIALGNRKKRRLLLEKASGAELELSVGNSGGNSCVMNKAIQDFWYPGFVVIWSFGLRLFWKVEQSKEQSKVEQARHCFFVDEFGNHESSSPFRVGGCAPHPPPSY